MSTILSSYIRSTYLKRKLVDRIMCGALVLAGIVALIPLFSVMGYVLVKGVPGLNLSFFTQLPQPVGESGGGMANALVGTLTLILLASAIGVGWGCMAGVFLAEYGDGKLGSIVRFSSDMLSS